MKTNISKDNISIGEIEFEKYALELFKNNNEIRFGEKTNEQTWNGLIVDKSSKFVGQFKNNYKHNFGYLLSNKIDYTGGFKNDEFHGLGLSKVDAHQFYMGEFFNGKKQGIGCENYIDYFNTKYPYNADATYILERGKIFGSFINNKKEGYFVSETYFTSELYKIDELFLFKDDKLVRTYDLGINHKRAKYFMTPSLTTEKIKNEIFAKEIQWICEIDRDFESNSIVFKFPNYELINGVKILINSLFIEIYIEPFTINVGLFDSQETISQFELSNDFYITVKDNVNTYLSYENRYTNSCTFKTYEYEINYSYDYNLSEFELNISNNEHIIFNQIDDFYHLFCKNQKEFKLYKDNDEYYFSEYEQNNISVVCLSELNNINIYSNKLDIPPRKPAPLEYSDFIDVPYKTILKYSELSIDCTKPYYLMIDTETNGLPLKHLSDSNIDKWPRLIQIAFLEYSKEGILLGRYSKIIKPFEFTIDNNQISGISQEIAENEGESLYSVLSILSYAINEAEVIVCHNVNFDINVIFAEYQRMNMDSTLTNKSFICTMIKSLKFMNSESYPKLSSLYLKLFGKEIENAHNALADIEATSKCFWRLKELKVI